ncbi:SMI1/KNR4 family protein [Paenibacillus chitinolyticus]|uniref:SMI1/KNR4 family protein n=1 Tax=Paenibacillus chitinolyticus TaxID=79263 RepID=UPI00366C1FD8
MIKHHIDRLEKLLPLKVGEDCQEEYETYLKLEGAGEEQFAVLEMKYGVILPDDFKEFYRYKNGSGYHFHILYPSYGEGAVSPFYLLSLEEIDKLKAYFCSEDILLSEHFEEDEIARLDKRIRPYYGNRKWLPIAQLAGGSLYLMLDFDPSEHGKAGQVIAFVHDPDFIYYAADSFAELLDISNKNLEDWEEIDY